MRLGALLGPATDSANANSLAERARQLEAEGYDSLWSAQAMGRGFMMPDPFTTLAIAASVTERVELGTAILQLPLYEPADVALKAFSLMQASGNRLLLGLGTGSTEVDHILHGSPFERRFKVFNQKLASLRQCFAEGRCNGVDLTPWPEVRGGPPLLYGTWGASVRRAAQEFDAWIGSAMHRTPSKLEEALADYRAAGGGRAIVTTIVLSDKTDPGRLGTLLGRLDEAGFDDAVVMFNPGAPEPETVRKLLKS